MTTSFSYSQPTTVVGGIGAGTSAGEYISMFGSRPLVVCGGSSSMSSGAFDDVRAGLDALHIEFVRLEGIPSNPGVAVAEAGVELARAHQADVIVAVGGGSVVDVAKAIAVGQATGRPIRSLLSGIRDPSTFIDDATPVVAIPTLPGSGSELNGTSVLTDEVTWRKLSMHTDLAAPRVAILDPNYAAQAPVPLLAAALADAVSHAVEAVLSARATVPSDALARAALLSIVDNASIALDTNGDREQRDEALLRCLHAAGLAGQALTIAGSIATHPLSHPLSARLGAHHGAAVAALEQVVIVKLADRWNGKAGIIARWLGARVASTATLDDQARALAQRLSRFNRAHGVTMSLAQMGMVDGMAEAMAIDVMESGSRGLLNTPGRALSDVDIASIYRATLKSRPTSVPNVAPLL